LMEEFFDIGRFPQNQIDFSILFETENVKVTASHTHPVIINNGKYCMENARHTGGVGSAAKVLAAHVKYLARSGTGLEGEAETFYGAEVDDISAREHVKEWAEDRHHFRSSVSADGKSIAPDFRRQLAAMAARGDVVRFFYERLNAGARTITPLQQDTVRGEVVQAGFHDRDLQTCPFAIVRDSQGYEHYSRLGAQGALPKLGAQVTVSKNARGVVRMSEIGVERKQGDTPRFAPREIETSERASHQAQTAQTRVSLSDQLERQFKTELGLHKHFIGIKTTQTEGNYRGTLQTSGGQFAVINRGASVAALRVEAAPALQIGGQVSASIGRNGLANIVGDLGLSL
jgi:hypothetical protein